MTSTRAPSLFALGGLRSRGTRLLAVACLWGGGATPLQGQSPDSLSTVHGHVMEGETGRPLAGVAVSLASGPGGTKGIGTRVTNEDGVFRFRQVPAGSYRVRATRLGFTDLQDTLRVGPGANLDLALTLSVSPVEMEPLIVVSRRPRLGALGDFELRRRTRSGTFFNRQDIEDRAPLIFTDLLRMVPGARVLPAGPNLFTVRLRGGCQPTLWVDGFKLMTPEGMDAILPTVDLEAVEVYHGASVPGQFASNGCGAIVVWTRRGEPVENSGSLWKRLAVAAGFVVLGWLLAH